MLRLNNKILCKHCFTEIKNGSTCPVCNGIARPREASALELNSILHGRYVVGRVLGKGGFSITYLAYDNKLDKVVAIKEFFPDSLVHRIQGESAVRLNDSNQMELYKKCVKRFYEEAQVISTISHPNVLDVYNLYYENGTAFYTMEYLIGNDLRNYVKRNGGPIKEKELITIIACVSEALETIHKRGILHRDIAPDNIFITNNGVVKLIDFGSARNIVNREKGFTVLIKRNFTPPEQYQAKGNQGAWTDIYALGATMVYCLTGVAPPDVAERMNSAQLQLNCSPMLAETISKMLEIRTEERFQNISELKKALIKTSLTLSKASAVAETVYTPEEPEKATDTPIEINGKTKLRDRINFNKLLIGFLIATIGFLMVIIVLLLM